MPRALENAMIPTQCVAILDNTLGSYSADAWYFHEFGRVCRVEVDKLSWLVFRSHICCIGVFATGRVGNVDRVGCFRSLSGVGGIGFRVGELLFNPFLRFLVQRLQ